MADSIIDGTGLGYQAAVTKDNQLSVFAESESAEGVSARSPFQNHRTRRIAAKLAALAANGA